MAAQSHLDHYNKKLAEEQAKLTKAEESAADVQTEFEVRLFFVLTSRYFTVFYRLGEKRPFCFASKLTILGSQIL
jgi:hypothetical protein